MGSKQGFNALNYRSNWSKATTIYDADDRPIESYGPAPSTWFGADRKPLANYTSQVPHSTTTYDEGILGWNVAYYNLKNNTLFGSPVLHKIGILNSDKTVLWTHKSLEPFPIPYTSGNDGVGLSATAK